MLRRFVVVALVVSSIGVLLTGCVPPVTTDPPAGAGGASPGCRSTTRGPVTDQSETVSVDGATRRYSITIPPDHVPGTTKPIPLVLDFHGLIEGTVGTHPLATQFSAKAIAEGFAVVDPIGSNDGFNWDVSPREDNPDLQFVDTLLDTLENTMCIDRSRVYSTGLSYGAVMTSMLMCMRSNTFAAAAPVAGMYNFCTPTDRKVPFVTFHGTNDPILPFAWFGPVPSATAAGYGCTEPTTVTLRPDPDPATGGPITRTTWDCRRSDTAAEFYVIGGGGHSWPGSVFFGLIGFIVGPTATSLVATDVIWDFFAQHHLSSN